jgi:hypothetical protein
LRDRRRSKKGGKNGPKILGLICLITLVIISLYIFLRPHTLLESSEKRAAIIDGLSATLENKTFWWTAQNMLKQAGYATYYFEGGSDTVDFYRSLPTNDFEIIVLRVHSAVNLENGDLAIFTNEEWSDAKASTLFLNDILNGRLAQVRVEENSTSYFGITPNFIKAMNGKFENTTVIMMGCDGLITQSMAEAFIQKGAKSYIGWDGFVTPRYVDAATIMLLQHLVLEKQTISEAVARTIQEEGNDPDYGGTLHHYP